MSASYLSKIATNYPEIVGKILFLFPSSSVVEITCRVNYDGSLTTENGDHSFETALKMVQSLINPSIKNVNERNEIFLEQNRKVSLYTYERRQQKKKTTNETPKNPTAKPKRKCWGFRMGVFNSCGEYKPIGLIRQISVDDGGVSRSFKCSKFRQRTGSRMCGKCSIAKESLVKYVESLRHDGLLCRGIKADPYVQLIDRRKWRNERRNLSIVDFVGNRLFSKTCTGKKIETNGRRCGACRKAATSLWNMNYRQRHPTAKNDENRIVFTANSRLTVAERIIKEKILKRRRDERREKANTAMKKLRTERNLLQKFVPKDPENRSIAVSLVNHLNNESDRIKRPTCRWIVGHDAQCGHVATSCLGLLGHVLNVHVGQQRDAHRRLNVVPMARKYVCGWSKCTRRRPFPNWKAMCHHAKEHAGSVETVRQFEILKNQITNLTRKPTGRRHCEAAKESASAYYRGKRSWENACAYSPFPLISGRSVRRLKNGQWTGTGMDEHTLLNMQKIAEHRPWLKHGILVCDEVYVRESIGFHSSTMSVSGLADDNKGELANKLLVFQYVSIFSKRRFRANVAWFACAKKAKDAELDDFFLHVGRKLASAGFHLHGLVCDGDPKNRRLQNTLIRHYGDERTASDSGIDHPFTSWIDRFYLLSDPTHCLKKFRNGAANENKQLRIPVPRMTPATTNGSGPRATTNPRSTTSQPIGDSSRSSTDGDSPREMHPIKWSHFIDVYQWQLSEIARGHRVDRQLKENHVKVENFEKMNTQSAVNIVSEPIERTLKEVVPDSAGTRYFINVVRTFWQAMNQRKTFYGQNAFEKTSQLRADLKFVADELELWSKTPGLDRKTEFITRECYEDAMRVCKGVPALIDQIFNRLEIEKIGDRLKFKPQFTPKLLTQDFLERDFGALRQSCGGTQNPPVQAAIYGLKSRNMILLSNYRIRCWK